MYPFHWKSKVQVWWQASFFYIYIYIHTWILLNIALSLQCFTSITVDCGFFKLRIPPLVEQVENLNFQRPKLMYEWLANQNGCILLWNSLSGRSGSTFFCSRELYARIKQKNGSLLGVQFGKFYWVAVCRLNKKVNLGRQLSDEW